MFSSVMRKRMSCWQLRALKTTFRMMINVHMVTIETSKDTFVHLCMKSKSRKGDMGTRVNQRCSPGLQEG